MAIFLHDILPDFYERLGDDHKKKLVQGQLCTTHIIYTNENHELWRPEAIDQTGTIATTFRITAAGQDAYRRTTSLASPKLKTNEEFPVIRAKWRRAILLKPAPVGLPKNPVPRGARIDWPLAVVIPMYGLSDEIGRAKFPQDFVARVSTLEYPEYFFLPENGGAVAKDSLLALFRITNVFEAHVEPLQWKMSRDVFEVILGQLNFYLTGVYRDPYSTVREMLLHPQGG